MKIPKIITKNNKQYLFQKQVNDNLFLYMDMYTKTNECFSKADLHLIDNSYIDKKIKGNIITTKRYLVKDKFNSTVEEFDTIGQVAKATETQSHVLKDAFKNSKEICFRNRWEVIEQEYELEFKSNKPTLPINRWGSVLLDDD